PATALALGNLDSDGQADLVVAAGPRLLLIHGRDRKLSQRSEERATVPPAVIEHRAFNTDIKSVALGNFTSIGRVDIAVVDETGSVFLLHSPERGNARRRLNLKSWQLDSAKENNWSGVTRLFAGHVTSTPKDTLLGLDAGAGKIRRLALSE